MKFLIRKSPDGFIQSVNDEISSILNRNFNSLFPEFICDEESSKYAKSVMPVELHEHESEYVIKAELPGVKKEDLDIDADKNHITINAKKEEEKEENDKHYKTSEFRYGEYSRTIYFPQEIDTDKANVTLEHGILKITAPKKESEKENIKKLTVN